VGKRRWPHGEPLNEGFMNDFFIFDNYKLTLLPPFDHKEPEDDDCGLPEHPVYSDYSKYLWKGHKRSGGIQIPGHLCKQTRRPAR
jgi:hypothetical protein